MGWAIIYVYKVNNVECLYSLTFKPIRLLLLGYSFSFWHIRMVTECLILLPRARVCLHFIAC